MAMLVLQAIALSRLEGKLETSRDTLAEVSANELLCLDALESSNYYD